jgi:hypothetical protein
MAEEQLNDKAGCKEGAIGNARPAAWLGVMNYRALAPSRAQEGHKTIESVKDQYQTIEFVKDQD